MSTKTDDLVMTVRIPGDLVDGLRDLGVREERSVAYLVRRAIRELLERNAA